MFEYNYIYREKKLQNNHFKVWEKVMRATSLSQQNLSLSIIAQNRLCDSSPMLNYNNPKYTL